MMNLFSALPGRRWLLSAALGLLAAGPAFGQIPSTIYVLGKALVGPSIGTPYLLEVNPANLATPSNTDLYTAGSLRAITGLLDANQPLLAIDVRPSTGQIYALAYNAGTQQARLYTLNPITNTLTAVGGNITLDLQDTNNGAGGSNTGNTIGTTLNVGFDFNPRLDRIRVVAPNRTNYVLNPNDGTLQATNTPLTYTAPAYTGRTPYIGAAAYTNSQLGLTGTTLYDVDVARNNGLLARQAPPGAGTLDQAAPLRFALRLNGGVYDLGSSGNGYVLSSPTNRLDLDITYDRAARTNHYYLLESRYRSAGGYSVNLYEIAAGDVEANTASNTVITAYGENITENITDSMFFNFYDLAAFTGFPKTWTGQAGDNWQTAGSWSPAGTPTASDDVVVPGNGTFVAGASLTVAVQPTVTNAQQAASLTLSNNALLTTANGGTLTLAGNLVNNESQVTGSGTGTIVLAGTSPLNISGNTATSFWNLGVGANGATTSAAVAIQRSVSVSGTLAIGADQAFTLLSSAGNTAYVVNNAGGTVSGIATVQRYITPTNPGAGYRHYSSPVSKARFDPISNTVTDLSTATFAPVVNSVYNSDANPRLVRPYPTVFAYSQARLATSNASYAVGDFDNGFISPAALTDTLSPGRGYAVNIPGTEQVDLQGRLRSGNYSSGPLARGAQTSAGYHLLGNPYPGSISYTTMYGASAGIQDALYVFRSTGPYSGSYSTYIATTNQSVNGGTNNIPLAQGFFVRAQPGGGTVNFTNTARTNQPETALFYRTASTAPTLALTLSGNGVANQTRIYFDPNATAGLDNGYDATYLPAAHGLNLASDAQPEPLAINGLPALTGTTTVPLHLHAATAGPFTLTVDELANLPAGYHAYLRDGRTNTYTDLATTPSVSLALAPADAATGRFAIVFSASRVLATAPAALAELVALYPNPAHGSATLLLPQGLRGPAAGQVEVLNALGQVVLRRPVAPGTPEAVELPLGRWAPGIYTVRVQAGAFVVSKRLTIE